MINAAIVLQSEHPSAFTKIYGMMVMERTFHALERGGVDTVLLPYAAEEKLQKVIERNKDWKIKFRFTDNFKSVFGEIKNGLVVLDAPMAISQAIPQQLIAEGSPEGQATVAQNRKAAFFPTSFLQKIKTVPHSVSDWEDVALSLIHISEPTRPY